MNQAFLPITKNEEIREAFGVRIKELRKQKKWQQKELANKVDVRFAQLNKYEGGLHYAAPGRNYPFA